MPKIKGRSDIIDEDDDESCRACGWRLSFHLAPFKCFFFVYWWTAACCKIFIILLDGHATSSEVINNRYHSSSLSLRLLFPSHKRLTVAVPSFAFPKNLNGTANIGPVRWQQFRDHGPLARFTKLYVQSLCGLGWIACMQVIWYRYACLSVCLSVITEKPHCQHANKVKRLKKHTTKEMDK